MAATIKEKTDYDTKIFAGRTGSFEVKKGGDLIFSKLDSGRFPKDEEIIEALK